MQKSDIRVGKTGWFIDVKGTGPDQFLIKEGTFERDGFFHEMLLRTKQGDIHCFSDSNDVFYTREEAEKHLLKICKEAVGEDDESDPEVRELNKAWKTFKENAKAMADIIDRMNLINFFKRR